MLTGPLSPHRWAPREGFPHLGRFRGGGWAAGLRAYATFWAWPCTSLANPLRSGLSRRGSGAGSSNCFAGKGLRRLAVEGRQPRMRARQSREGHFPQHGGFSGLPVIMKIGGQIGWSRAGLFREAGSRKVRTPQGSAPG